MINVTASNARKTDTGASYKGVPGVDVDVVVTMPEGATIHGAVTLLPREDGLPGMVAWGDPGNWVSGALLQAIKATFAGDDFSDALDALESAAAAQVQS